MLQVVFLAVFSLACIYAMPVSPTENTTSPMEHKSAENLSEKFHLLKKVKKDFAEKIEEMRKAFGLKITGKNLTMICGTPDDFSETGLEFFYNRWQKTHLTYSILIYSFHIPRQVVDYSIQKALQVWSDVTPLTFRKVPLGYGDIVISFVRRFHFDCHPFDGPGGVLAHAFPPGNLFGGEVHFDNDENWTTDSTGINLFLVAAHEFGHALGLSHSNDPTVLMYKYYQYMETSYFRLPADDVRRIQTLYGRK